VFLLSVLSHAKRMALRLAATEVTEFPLETLFCYAAVLKSNHKTPKLGDYNSFFMPTVSPSVLFSKTFQKLLFD